MHVLLLCLLGLQLASVSMAARSEKSKKRFKVDLTTGKTSGLPPGITWHQNLTSGVANKDCTRQGVLKLTFSPKDGRIRAQIKLTYDHSTLYTFHIGDSSSNDGWAGDYGSSDHFAEVNTYNNALTIHDTLNRPNVKYGYRALIVDDFVGLKGSKRLTVNVADKLATIENRRKYVYFRSENMFALNGQPDKYGVNYDLYLGMNRVLYTRSSRTGTGLCKVSIQFYNTTL